MWTISASGLKTPTPRNATHSHTHARYVFILPPRHGGSCSPVRCRPPKLHSTRRPEVQQRDMAKGQRVSAEKGRTAESCGRREAMYHFFPESLRGSFSSLAQPSGHDGDTEREFHLLHFFWPRHLLSPLHPPLLLILVLFSSGLSTQPALSLGWDACVQTNVHSLVSRRRPQATGTGLMLSCRSHR